MSESVKSCKTNKSVKSVTLKSNKSDKPGKPIKGLKSDCQPKSKKCGASSDRSSAPTDADGDIEICRVRKSIFSRKRSRSSKCSQVSEWDCNKDSLWRIYMKTLAADARKRMEEEREAKCLFPDKKPKPFDVPCLPCPPALSFPYELYAMNQGRRIIDVLGPTTAGIWDSLRDPRSCIDSASIISDEFEWPRLYPCLTRDIVKERKILARKVKMRMLGASPCEIEEIDSPESSEDERQKELAHQKELVHVRIPFTYRKLPNLQLVDRDVGENPGLVSGDYTIFHLASQRCGDRYYTNVCLRGTTGMHLAELARARDKTWKFCMFQGLVALLAKTQLRYKFAWSVNVDYIYEHAWMIFLHVGYLNVKPNQRFDDVLVYNYKYSVELQLVHELKNVRVVQDVPFDFFEKQMKRQRESARKELTLTKCVFGTQKLTDLYGAPVHRETRKIERWFDQLEDIYSNCILRTSRFSLAFWQDGNFWYAYNPYRCDKYGFWQDNAGRACIMKFCSRQSLKRYLVILTLRAYAYGEAQQQQARDEYHYAESVTTKSYASSTGKRKRFTLQIYQLLYHTCRIHNVKLLLREARKPRARLVDEKPSELCTFDPLDAITEKYCEEPKEDNLEMEKHEWLEANISWARYPDKQRCGQADDDDDDDDDEPPKWHNYEVIESKRLYILWGKKHISQKIFPEDNRGKQAITCYAVCAAMCRINTPEYWEADSLDNIVVDGDKFYSERYLSHELCVKKSINNLPVDDWDERPSDKFRVGNIVFDVLAKPKIHGRLFYRDEQSLWRTLQRFFSSHAFAVLTCESAQLAVFKHYGVYYLLDVASYGPPIFERGAGMVYLLRATCFVDLVMNLVLIIGTPECCKFALRPLTIVKVVDLADADECGRVRLDKCEDKAVVAFKPICPKDNDKKSKAKRRAAKLLAGGTKTFDQTVCVDRDSKIQCPTVFR